MLVPLNWLKEYVALPANPAELVERLTLAGLESAGVKLFGVPVPDGLRVKPDDAGLPWDADKVVVAKVLKIEKHPDADKLKLVTVDYGAAEPKTVVTGAPNIAPGESGMKVILGLKGTRYFYLDKDGKKGVFTLEPKALRGIMNDAMCMSNYELGVSEDHEGIIILDDSDPVPGTPATQLLGETVVELDVLPNMARCLSLLGIAREVAALVGGTVTEPQPKYPTAGTVAGMVNVQIENPALCRRYTATVIKNVTVGPAPRWMRTRLNYAGMRPITNAVDVTNYVMLEYGQPLHAFDYDVLVKRAGGVPTVTVRPAKAGETLVTLDKQERKLSPDNLIIADTAGPIALAGVMGGLDTEVTDSTKTILLESAHFDPVSVRKTARQFNLFSEASTRFSKGVHPETAVPAAARAAELFHKYAGGEVVGGIVDTYPAPIPPQTVTLNRSEIERVLGFGLPDGEVERVLTALQFKLDSTPWGWSVTTPPTRLDIQAGAADLIEELARVSGYDRLPERLLPLEMPAPKGNRSLAVEQRIQDVLVDLGLSECITYALTSPEAEARLVSVGGKNLPPHPPSLEGKGEQNQTPPTSAQEGGGRGGVGSTTHVTLLNPISPERSVMRTTLLPGLLEVAARNLQVTDSVSLFEFGFVYLPTAGLPDEPRRVAVVLCGRRGMSAWDDALGVKPKAFDFFDLKGVVESLAAALHLPAVTFAPTAGAPHLHPGKAAELRVNGTAVGTLGELHPKVRAAFGVSTDVLVAELDAEALIAATPERYPYKPFSTLPAAKRDVAVIVPDDTPAEKVLGELRAAGGELLTEVSLFDVYRGDSIPAGTKSLAFALTYQPKEKTLTDKEIDKAHEKIEGRLRHVLKAKIRGKDA